MAKSVKKNTPSAPAPDVLKRIEERGAPPVSSDKLDAIKALVREDRAILQRIKNGNALLKTLKEDHNEYKMNKLPTAMEALGIPSITVEGNGNEPPFTAVLKPYYHANIRSERGKRGESWTREQRQAAFDYLKEIGHDDILRTTVTYSFPKGVTMKQVQDFCREAAKIGVGNGKSKMRTPAPEVEYGVPWSTLTSWLKEQVEVHKFIPDLEKIGGVVGKVVEITGDDE